jgi:hypothetical protein
LFIENNLLKTDVIYQDLSDKYFLNYKCSIMKNDNKESKISRLANNTEKVSEDKRNPSGDEHERQSGTRKQRFNSEQEKASDALSQGYFPDGPGGNYSGA